MLSCVGDHILHSVSDQIQKLQNCFTSSNKNLGGGPQIYEHLLQSLFTGQFLDNDIWHCFHQSNPSSVYSLHERQLAIYTAWCSVFTVNNPILSYVSLYDINLIHTYGSGSANLVFSSYFCIS